MCVYVRTLCTLELLLLSEKRIKPYTQDLVHSEHWRIKHSFVATKLHTNYDESAQKNSKFRESV